MKKNLVLLGMMGTGKSTIGKILAKKLGFKHIDTDKLIEKKNKMKINKMFEMKGENFFRNEEEILQRSDQSLDIYYAENITPFKAKLENWYLSNRSFFTDIKLIFLTAWVIIFKNSKLPLKFFKDLPKNELLTND